MAFARNGIVHSDSKLRGYKSLGSVRSGGRYEFGEPLFAGGRFLDSPILSHYILMTGELLRDKQVLRRVNRRRSHLTLGAE